MTNNWAITDDPFDASAWGVEKMTNVEAWQVYAKNNLIGPARYAVGLALAHRADELDAGHSEEVSSS